MQQGNLMNLNGGLTLDQPTAEQPQVELATANADPAVTLKQTSTLLDYLELKGFDSPLPLHVIPNYMGINLVNVERLDWVQQDDGQMVSLSIKFLPDPDDKSVPPLGVDEALSLIKSELEADTLLRRAVGVPGETYVATLQKLRQFLVEGRKGP